MQMQCVCGRARARVCVCVVCQYVKAAKLPVVTKPCCSDTVIINVRKYILSFIIYNKGF